MPSRYERLREHLTPANPPVMTMTFADVERVLGAALPESARVHQAWWANGGHAHSQAWTSTGRRAAVNLRAQTVTFSRDGAGQTRTKEEGRARPPLVEGRQFDGEANSDQLVADQRKYLDGSYERFLAFGGPCVHFHQECLKAGDVAFLSDRHVEMLYATLTAWGMHRLGDPERTKTKLIEWKGFQQSIVSSGQALKRFRGARLRDLTAREYSDILDNLAPVYRALRVSTSEATLVANSKTLFHLLPNLIPPIDRQYTIRFFRQKPAQWKRHGKFGMIALPKGVDAQFDLFRSTCLSIKRLAERIEPSLLAREDRVHRVSVPKVIDNAIVNYVSIESKGKITPD